MGSSRTRAQTRVPCIGRQILNHCATREVLDLHFDKQIKKRWEEMERIQVDKTDKVQTPNLHSGADAQSEYERYTWIQLGQSVQSFIQLATEFRLSYKWQELKT